MPSNSSSTAPATTLLTITKSDSTVYEPAIRYIYVGGAGNVAIKDPLGTTVVFTAPPVGTILGPFQAASVMSTSTTATLLIGMV
jgi:hypothetical protein